MGLNDTHDAFVRYCALRVYVPSTWEGPLPPLGSEAPFEQYLRMPAGLRKVRREQEAWAAAQPWVDELHKRGFNTIQDLGKGMPMLDLLESAGLPAPLAGKMVEMRETLLDFEERPLAKNLNTSIWSKRGFEREVRRR